MIPKRRITGKAWSSSWVAANAASGAAKAVAHSTAPGTASTPHPDGTPPSRAATTRNADAPRPARMAVHVRKPPYTSDAPSGVVTMAWNVRIHFTPAMTGHSVPPAAFCMALAASSPGVTNTRYDMPCSPGRPRT